MLWDLQGDGASQYLNSWTTAIKLAWNCPRATRSYLVQDVLACGYTSAKADILARYGKFFKGLRTSPCWEVTVLANLVARDVRSSTGRNIKYVGESSGRDPWHSGTAGLRAGVEKTEKVEVADVDRWRVKYLGTLLAQRQECHYLGQEDLEEEVQVLIDSLCVN